MNFAPYAVHVYRDGKHLGRLTPDGGTTRRVLFAGMFPKGVAEEIAASINSGEDLIDDSGDWSAKVRPFDK